MSIAVEALRFAYGAHSVLAGVGFTVENGEMAAVMGPNGAGKTTLFRCILRLQRGYSGRVLVDGSDVAGLSPKQLAHRIAYIPQLHAQTFGYSVLDMVLMGTSHTLGTLSQPGRREHTAAMDALSRVGISHLHEKSFTHISGGEQQLVLIARALAQQTRTLLLDEPTASLDYGNQTHVLDILRGLAREGYAILFSTHNPQHALWYADRALALNEGRVVANGPPAQVVDEALIETLYHMRVSMAQTAAGLLISPEIDAGRD